MNAGPRTLVVPWPPDGDAEFEAFARLRRGGLALYPTETVWGIGTLLSTGAEGVARTLAAKGYDEGRPLIVVAATTEMAFGLWSRVPDAARVLAAAAWPGPLTLVGPARDRLPDGVLGRAGDLTTIAVRVPGEPALRRVLSRLGEPLISTSANRKGQAPPVRLDAVEVEALGPDVVFAAEACEGGEPSTIIDVVAQPPRVLRMGAWKPPLS